MLASRSLFLGAKDKLYSLCDCKIMLNESETLVLWSPGKNGRWKRMLGLVYFKPSRLVIFSPEGTLRKNEMR